MFVFTDAIKTWINETHIQILYLPIFAVFALQWYNDITLAYDMWSWLLPEHYSIKNWTYIVGKILSSGLLFLSFLNFVTDAQATPRTRDI